jgi:hydrogenase maturation protease
MKTPVRIIGLGSSHGDDAIAWMMVDILQQKLHDKPEYELQKMEGSQGLLDLFDGTGTYLILDAATNAGPLGTFHRLTWPDARIMTLKPGTTHDLGLEAVLTIAESLGTLPESVVIYAIAVQGIEPHQPMNPQLAACVPALVQAILRDLTSPVRSPHAHA